jgi:hypothetical protein
MIPNTTLALRLVPGVPFPFTTFTTFAGKLARFGVEKCDTIKKCKILQEKLQIPGNPWEILEIIPRPAPGGVYCYMLYPGAVRGRLLAVVEWGRVFTPADGKTR